MAGINRAGAAGQVHGRRRNRDAISAATPARTIFGIGPLKATSIVASAGIALARIIFICAGAAISASPSVLVVAVL